MSRIQWKEELGEAGERVLVETEEGVLYHADFVIVGIVHAHR